MSDHNGQSYYFTERLGGASVSMELLNRIFNVV